MYTAVDVSHGFRINSLYTAFTERIESDYFYAGERHNFWELVFIVSGSVGVTAGEDARVMEAGQGILHSPMEFHRVWFSGAPADILIFTFRAEGLPEDAAGSFHLEDARRPRELLDQIRNSFLTEGIFIVAPKQEPDAQLAVKAWEIFLLELLRQKTPMPRLPQTRPARNYATIVRVLESNVNQNLTIEEIAGLCSMSPVSVKKTFSRYAGMGVMNYFTRLKVQAASSMLREGASVQETAAALGFSSQNYFSTVFKRTQGVSPTHYKAQFLEKKP